MESSAGLLLGWTFGIVIDGRQSGKDQRIAELEGRVRQLADESEPD